MTTPSSAKLWSLRILLLVIVLIVPSKLADSPFPSLTFAVAWGPNGLFVVMFMRGTLRLPQSLVAVRPIEPVLYNWLGAGFVKRIVETREWPLIHGWKPLPMPTSAPELLDRIEAETLGAEVCHGAAFLLALGVTILFVVRGRFAEAGWVLGYNVALNGYPVMVQRSNRYRVQRLRALRQTTITFP